MNNIRIEIDTDYKDYTDEMEELTRELKNIIEENDELDIEEVKIPTKLADKYSKGQELMELGKLVIDAVISPEVAATLVGVIALWIKDKRETNSIAKSVTIDYNDKKHKIEGHSGDDTVKIIAEINKGG